jgi:alkanesulfonate monooxygenase SsuD/methylene tetrahydromethanopterin reductase-like flavin-dependent oxidoreductase (luciferase family)
MEFGIGDNHMNCLSGGDHGARYQRFVETALEAEALGYRSIYVTEHHFSSDPTYRPFDEPESEYPSTDSDIVVDPLALHIYLAARTTRLRLGTAVACTHWDHPVRLTERAALLDVLSQGRLELGVARGGGGGGREEKAFSVPRDPGENARKYREELAIILGSWSGEPFSHEGEFFQIPEIRRIPTPVQKRPPIWLAAGSDESIAFAGSNGIPYQSVAWPWLAWDVHRAKREKWERAAAEAGHDTSGALFPVALFLYCAPTDEEAYETAYPYLRRFRAAVEQHYEWAREGTGNERFTNSPWSDETSLELPLRNHLIGSPASCLERLAAYRDVGLNYPICMVNWGLMPSELVSDSMRLFAQSVIPEASSWSSAASIAAS